MSLNPDKMKAAVASVTAMPNDDELHLLSTQARVMLESQQKTEELTRLLELEAKLQKSLTEDQIPTLMKKLGFEKFSLSNGLEVSVKLFYGAHIKAEKIEEAHQWLRDHNQGALIKTDFQIKFGMGEEVQAQGLRNMLRNKQLPFKEKEAVHPSTLVSYVKETIESGIPIPVDLFGVFTGQKASIKQK